MVFRYSLQLYHDGDGIGICSVGCGGIDMKARFMIESPDEINATMKITMTVKEWTELRDQLDNKWPSWKLSSAISDVLSQARKVYYADHEIE